MLFKKHLRKNIFQGDKQAIFLSAKIIYANDACIYYRFCNRDYRLGDDSIRLYRLKFVVGSQPELLFKDLVSNTKLNYYRLNCAYNAELNKFVFLYIIHGVDESELCIDLYDVKDMHFGRTKNKPDFACGISKEDIGLVQISQNGKFIIFRNRDKQFEIISISNKGEFAKSKLPIEFDYNLNEVIPVILISSNGQYFAMIKCNLSFFVPKSISMYEQKNNCVITKELEHINNMFFLCDISNSGELVYTVRRDNSVYCFDYKAEDIFAIKDFSAKGLHYIKFSKNNFFVVCNDKLQKACIERYNNYIGFKNWKEIDGKIKEGVGDVYCNADDILGLFLQKDGGYRFAHYVCFYDNIVEQVKNGTITDYADIAVKILKRQY